jgi:hypothetical protein
VALHDAAQLLMERKLIAAWPLQDFVAAVSVGVFKSVPVLDLDYEEDSNSETDMNVVMTGTGGLVEVQGTAEGNPFSRAELDAMVGSRRGRNSTAHRWSEGRAWGCECYLSSRPMRCKARENEFLASTMRALKQLV